MFESVSKIIKKIEGYDVQLAKEVEGLSDVDISDKEKLTEDVSVFPYKEGNNEINDSSYSELEEEYNLAVSSFSTTDKAQSNKQLQASKEKYPEEEWNSIKPEKDKFLLWETGAYTYTTSDGTTITLEDIDGVEIYQNKETGEIVVIGAKDANIEGSNENVKISIYDSAIDSIEMGTGDDSIYMENSIVEEVEGGSGNDKIEIASSQISEVKGGTGHDEIIAKSISSIGNIKASDGNDAVIIDNSTVNGKIETNLGDDSVIVNNSKISEIFSGFGDDNVKIDNSQIDNIDLGFDNDVLVVNSSGNIGSIKGRTGKDTISVDNSKVKNIDGGWGADTINIKDSTVEIEKDKSDKVTDSSKSNEVDNSVETEEVSPYESMDINSLESAVNITDSKTGKYSDKDLTPEEQVKVLTIDFFTENLNNIIEQFEAQESEDGVVRDSYNWVKELVDLGISKQDIQSAISEQEQMITELQTALNGEGSETFEEVFKRWTGIDYNEENVIAYQETMQEYSLAVNGLTKTENFKYAIQEAKTVEDALELYKQYYGDEKTAIAELNKMLQSGVSSNSAPFAECVSIEVNENNELVRKFITGYKNGEPVYETVVDDITEADNMLRLDPGAFDFNRYGREYTEMFESTMGKTLEELQSEIKTSQLDAYGKGNSFQKLIDRYCAEQEEVATAIASIPQVAGLGLILVGGVVTFVNPPVGATLMNAGKYTSIIGTFSNQGIELLDDIASENGLSKEEGLNLLKETVQDIALLYSGSKINSVSGTAKDVVLNNTQSKTLAFLAEIGTDASMSLLTDMVLTGEIDITGEGISQLLGIISGLAGAKVNAYTKESFDKADNLYKSGDVDGALKSLEDSHIPKKQIYNYYKTSELEKVYNEFKKTNSLEKALNVASSSKILSGDDVTLLTKISKLYAYDYIGSFEKYILYDFETEQGKVLLNDIDMMYKAMKNDIYVADLLVPKSDSIEVAMQNAEIGDVFEVENSKNIYIKTDDGQYQELNLSKKTYCKLFPAVERYSSGQQNSGDCYLVSVLNSMMANTQTRKNLLSCFSENSDGSIVVKMPNSDTQITLKNGQRLSSLGIEADEHMSGALGMQLLEYAYKVELVDTKINENQSIITKNEQQIVDIDNELETSYQEYINKHQSQITYEEYIKQIDTLTDESLQRTKELIAEKNKLNDEIKSKQEELDEINSNPNYFEELGGNGGYPMDAFKTFGLDAWLEEDTNLFETIDKIIENPELQNDYIIVAGTNMTKEQYEAAYNDPNDECYKEFHENPEEYQKLLERAPISLPESLVEMHAYSVQVRVNETTGKTEIVVINPWDIENSQRGINNKTVVLSVSEFKEYFDEIDVAKIS